MEYSSYFFEVRPNPASDEVNIHLHGHEADAQLYIHDQFGRLLWSQPLDEYQSQFNVKLDDSRFVSGLYFVSFFSNGERITERLVIAK